MIRSWTLDAGAVIAYQDGNRWMRQLVLRAVTKNVPLTIPATVLAESWRGGRGKRGFWSSDLLSSVIVEPLTEALAKQAGELIGRVPGATAIDATVAISAAQRGDTVITSDPTDLQRLADDLGTIYVWSPKT
jgi:predicted nucleic acid-binding protein